jgi:hypothetical protein
MKPIFEGWVRNGRLQLDDEQGFRQYVKTFDGKPVDLIIEKATNKRTLPQLRYLFGVVYKLIADEIGESDVYKVHRFLMQELSPEVVEFVDINTGEIVHRIVGGSTVNFNSEQMALYIDSVIQWGVEFLNIVFPEAGQVTITNNSKG